MSYACASGYAIVTTHQWKGQMQPCSYAEYLKYNGHPWDDKKCDHLPNKKTCPVPPPS